MSAPSSSKQLSAGSSKHEPKEKIPKLEITDKLRVLCLHGYRQTGDSFKSKIGSFRKHVGKYAEFIFASAPHLVESIIDENSEGALEQRSWWFNSQDEVNFKGTNKNMCAFKFQESLRYVEKVWEEQGPFQGLLGFSQGACFVGLLCGIAQRNMCTIRPQFAIMSSGFLSGSLVHMRWYEDPILIPSLHIFGEADEIIPSEMSIELLEVFNAPKVLRHPGGHYFPATSALKQTYIDFFQDRLQEHLEAKELERINNEELILLEEEQTDEKSSNSDDDNSVDTDYDFDHPKQCDKHVNIKNINLTTVSS